LGDKIFGTPKAPGDPVGTALTTANTLANPKTAGRVAWVLNKVAGLPALASASGNGLAKTAGWLAPYADWIGGGATGWPVLKGAYDTVNCYNKTN
jgi:hypothetical protein